MVKKPGTGRKQWDGKSVQELRKHMGLTQNELSQRLGIRQQTVSEWETGMYRPRGASSTLLSMIAEQAKFKYQAGSSKKKT